jgi:hypothetical protein
MVNYTHEQYKKVFGEGRAAVEARLGAEFVARKMAEKYPAGVEETPIAVPSNDEAVAAHASLVSPLFDEKKFRAALPAEMLVEKRWVRYFLKPKPEGGTAKIPLGNHSDPNTWSTFDDCVAKIENKQQGIGYNFLGGEIQGLDIDHCRNPRTGVICNEAMLLLSRLPSWAEYSVSGQGIHVLFKGTVRGKDLKETCLQFWHSKKSPRFFALTCNMVGEAFTALKDIGDDFNYIFATAKHISAKIREELKAVDHEQWLALPKERETEEPVTREKGKTKTRKVVKDFDIKDFLQFYNIPIDNECDNEIGHCIRVASCPIKNEPHVGQNGTTTNFIYPTKDGGLAFHCQSTGCVDYSVSDVIKKLAEEKGPYPNLIYEKKQHSESNSVRGYRIVAAEGRKLEHKIWLWPRYLFGNHLVHLAGESGQGKSPLTRDLIARLTSGREWPDGAKNTAEKRGVLLLSGEDDWSTDTLPHLKFAGADLSQVHEFVSTVTKDDETFDVATALDQDVKALEEVLKERNDIGLIVIDPVTNYLGRVRMNHEDELRPGLLMPLARLAQRFKVCVLTVGHLNKSKDVQLLDRVMGARAFTAVARQTLFCSPDDSDESEFAHVMGFGRKTTTPGLKYRTVSQKFMWEGQESEVVLVEWGGASKQDIEASINAPAKKSEKSANKQVQVLVRTLLREGPKPSAMLEQAIKDAGIDCFNWQRAAKGTPARTRQIQGKKHGGWEWFLTTPEQAEFDKGELTR